jgi:hypothetical protein
MSGVVDPETLYTKQNCIGMTCQDLEYVAYITQVVVALAKSIRGMLFFYISSRPIRIPANNNQG